MTTNVEAQESNYDQCNFVLTDAESPLDNIVTLYSTLRQGQSPVLGAQVHAVVEADNMQQTVYLVDNGKGSRYNF